MNKQSQIGENGAENEAPTDHHFEPALCVVGTSDISIWGKNSAERLVIQFARSGVSQTVSLEEASQRNGPVIFVKADVVLDQPIVIALTKRLNLLLMSGDEGANLKSGSVPVAAATNGANAQAIKAIFDGQAVPSDLSLIVRSPSELDAAFWDKLRKREVPYVLTLTTEKKQAIEWRMFMGTYKGATDFVTLHVWPRPAFYVTRAIAPTFITPNMVTTVSAVMVVLAYWWFSQGHYGLGIAAAWMMTFLDTVDGKLARTTLTASKWGDIFDHGIDLIHPPFWYYAWGLGLAASGFVWSDPYFWTVFGVIMGGYVVQRIMEGIAIKWLGLEIHIWRPIDTFFRKITARRNPNLAIMMVSAIIGRPDWGLLAVAAWTVICLVLHGVQLVQAFAVKPKGEALQSWMTKPLAKPVESTNK